MLEDPDRMKGYFTAYVCQITGPAPHRMKRNENEKTRVLLLRAFRTCSYVGCSSSSLHLLHWTVFAFIRRICVHVHGFSSQGRISV